MDSYRIAVIGGDGVGPEVLTEGCKVMDAIAELAGFALEYERFPWGCAYYQEHGEMMPQNGLDVLQDFDAIYLGAIGGFGVPDHISLGDLLLRIRRGFDQYVNLRPTRLMAEELCPLKGVSQDEIDLVVVRENAEGEYAHAGGRLYQGTPNEVAVQTAIFTRRGTERIMRYAFDLCRHRDGKKRLTAATKSNANAFTMVFWEEVLQEVARDYPDIEVNWTHVDALVMNLIRKPQWYDVIVASNLFGDILTDETAALQGSLGLAAGANINPERRFPSMFEPVHGSAPDIAGQGIANPIGAVWAGAMMLEHLGEQKAAQVMMGAIEAVLREGQVRTADLGGNASTAEMGDALAAKATELMKD
ncbi:MAG TPA: tartrate dehydrogenase [Firmicutes bacterium]|jgi:tartrate dehydrogenase/decarboxylase/D-malate dehydrogenase|nr:tartrate dehydrogenase [Bacillota bacterium]